VKPDRFLRNYISVFFLSAFSNEKWFNIGISKKPLGCGVAVAEGIKAFTVAGSGDFSPQLNSIYFPSIFYFGYKVFVLRNCLKFTFR